MSKGGMKVEHPVGEADCDMSFLIMAFVIVVQFMHGILVDNTLLVVEEICAMDQQFGHSILMNL